MKRYKVFLASSSELAIERKEIAIMVARRNNAWTDKDVYVELVVWEDLLHSIRGERIQDYFNREMLKCDIVVVLFHKKVGQFTEEEFKLAYENLKKGGKPNFLFFYFKNGKIDIEIELIKHTLSNFNKKYKPIIKNHQKEISDWADRAMEKLHGLSDKKLLEFFPNTTEADLKEFRDSYVNKT